MLDAKIIRNLRYNFINIIIIRYLNKYLSSFLESESEREEEKEKDTRISYAHRQYCFHEHIEWKLFQRKDLQIY